MPGSSRRVMWAPGAGWAGLRELLCLMPEAASSPWLSSLLASLSEPKSKGDWDAHEVTIPGWSGGSKWAGPVPLLAQTPRSQGSEPSGPARLLSSCGVMRGGPVCERPGHRPPWGASPCLRWTQASEAPGGPTRGAGQRGWCCWEARRVPGLSDMCACGSRAVTFCEHVHTGTEAPPLRTWLHWDPPATCLMGPQVPSASLASLSRVLKLLPHNGRLRPALRGRTRAVEAAPASQAPALWLHPCGHRTHGTGGSGPQTRFRQQEGETTGVLHQTSGCLAPLSC